MSTLTTRASKGSELTHAEVDANWNALNTDKLENLVEDLTPQLGADLQVNGNDITSVSNGDVTLTPNGTGDLVLDGLKWPQADGTANYVLETDGAGQLAWTAQTDGGGTNGTFEVAITGTSEEYASITGLVNGSNLAYTLPNTPNDSGKLVMTASGFTLPPTAWTRSGAVVTLGASYVVATGGFVMAQYYHD